MHRRGVDSVHRSRVYILDGGESGASFDHRPIGETRAGARGGHTVLRTPWAAPGAPRLASGYRQYSPDNVAYLRFIRRAMTLGFSLKGIAELFGLCVNPTVSCQDVRAQAERKLSEVDAKICVLKEMKVALQ
jgi:MerR, DNA binding